MGVDTLITGYYDYLSGSWCLSSAGEENDALEQMGPELAPFFLPEHLEIPHHLQNEEFIFNPEVLLSGPELPSLKIPSEVKDILSTGILVASAFLVSEIWIPLALAAGIAGVANVMRLYAEPGTIEYQISEFMLKVNKVILFSTSAMAAGGAIGGLIGSGATASILGSGFASIFNSAYNIIEETIEYGLIPPPPGKLPTSGIDKHSCVDYADGSLSLPHLGVKVGNKMLGRTAKQSTKAFMEEILYDTIWTTDPFFSMPLSLIANFASNFTETIMNNGTKDIEHHANRDFIAAVAKTITKTSLEQLRGFTMGGVGGDYLISSFAVFASVLARTFYDGYWDPYLPDSLKIQHIFHDDPEVEDTEDFENES